MIYRAITVTGSGPQRNQSKIGKHGGRKGPVETIRIARIIETEDLLRRC